MNKKRQGDRHGRPWEVFDERVIPELDAQAMYGNLNGLKTAGQEWAALCPFHSDNDPSLSINPETKLWHCFGCQEGGGPIEFLQKQAKENDEDLTWSAAARRVAKLAGVDPTVVDECLDLTEEQRERLERERRRSSLFNAFFRHAEAALRRDCPAAEKARSYLMGRGFLGEDLSSLNLGVHVGPEEVLRHLLEAGFDGEEIKATGIDGEVWANRVVGLCRDPRGRARGVWGRKPANTEGGLKYVFNNGLDKKKIAAYGLSEALDDGQNQVVLVEGLMDAYCARAREIANVISIGGAGGEMNATRWDVLARQGVHSVTLLLDNDDGGHNGIQPALAHAHEAEQAPEVYVLDPSELGEAKDLDELITRSGPEAAKELFKKRQPAAVWQGKQHLDGITPETHEAAKREALNSLADYIEQDLDGEWSGRDRKMLLDIAAERTGWEEGDFEPILAAAAERGRENAARQEIKMALGKASETVEDGELEDAVSGLKRAITRSTSRTLDEPQLFDVDRLDKQLRDLTDGRKTGIEALDDRLSLRMHPGELIVPAGRTGHGKTSFEVALYSNVLRRAPQKDADEMLLFYTLEESECDLYTRLLTLETSSAATVTLSRIRDLRQHPSRRSTSELRERAAVKKAMERLRDVQDHLMVVHRSGWTADQIAAHARRVADKRPLGLVVVDYLQRVSPPEGWHDRRDIEVSQVARTFKGMAQELSVPVIAGAQINRQAVPKKYGEKLAGESYQKAKDTIRKARPQLHHLREGGAEQEADVVLGLLNYRADYEESTDHQAPRVTQIDVGVLKRRHGGESGRWVPMAFDGPTRMIRDPKEGETI